ncbi:glucuronate isomerase [Pseudomaricurvus alcaniphilus]|uniref:glucuronate isomerase n=1 Tax=Pseudomaricurvus alcaniphilus TaxID=1166482 RepID=UPI00140A5191|nr:glucuronate isomerase [Pseudomaricurvus alcaniphilus]NHN35792.1 glucuronate isomerase [Pseudomaricurvus alcaniphilus]
MATPLLLHPDRLFPAQESARSVARQLYDGIKNLPIISPHGHTDPAWFAGNAHFPNPHALFIAPDHYLVRMLYSQGIGLGELGIASKSGEPVAGPRQAWQVFARNYFLFRGTPTGLWLNHVFSEVFGLDKQLDESTSDLYYDTIAEALQSEAFRPRALFDNFNIEFLATTESPTDSLRHHQAILDSDWSGRVVTSYRPDPVVDPEHLDFKSGLHRFGEMTGEDACSWQGYLNAHRKRREDFIAVGATASDHGHPTAATANLSKAECIALFAKVQQPGVTAADAELFRAQMLTEMARMSLDDGMVMQIHPGSYRNHNTELFNNYGRDRGADLPCRVEYTRALKPLLDLFGNETELSIILFTLDESNYSRELAPLAGHYPCLRLGPAWWFHDSPEGMMRYREQTTETAGFYNTVGFNDDTRAFLSIPARHDVARRVDCAFLARLVVEHRLSEQEAHQVAADLTYNLPKRAYRLDTSERS